MLARSVNRDDYAPSPYGDFEGTECRFARLNSQRRISPLSLQLAPSLSTSGTHPLPNP
jgi:hypothetical protein